MLAGHFLFVSQELPLAVIHCFRNVLLCIVILGTETTVPRHPFFPLCENIVLSATEITCCPTL
jgi:hypothetical protein